jgi:hypothetical protein
MLQIRFCPTLESIPCTVKTKALTQTICAGAFRMTWPFLDRQFAVFGVNVDQLKIYKVTSWTQTPPEIVFYIF